MKSLTLVLMFCVPLLAASPSAEASSHMEAPAQGNDWAKDASVEAVSKLLDAAGKSGAATGLTSLAALVKGIPNMANPCKCTIQLLNAILKDVSELKAGAGGLNFAAVMINCFNIPQFTSVTYIQLTQQGEILSRAAKGRTKTLRTILNNLDRKCNKRPAAPKAGTPPPAAGEKPAAPAAAAPKKKTPKWTVKNPCPGCQKLKDQIGAAKKEQTDLTSQRDGLKKDIKTLKQGRSKIKKAISTVKSNLAKNKTDRAKSTDPKTGATTVAKDLGDGYMRVTTTTKDGTKTSKEEVKPSAKKPLAELDKLQGELRAADDEIARAQGEVGKLNTQIATQKAEIKNLKKQLKDCVRKVCNKK